MNLNKLYFIEKYGEDWKNEYNKWSFIQKMQFLRKHIEFEREYKQEWDHNVDALKYSMLIKEPLK